MSSIHRMTIPIDPPHPASAGVDGDPGEFTATDATLRVLTTIQRQGQKDAQDIELDALTRQLIRTVCVKNRLRVPDDTQIPAITWGSLRSFAALAVALSQSDLVSKCKSEAIRDVADEHNPEGDVFCLEAKIAREAIDRFLEILRSAGR